MTRQTRPAAADEAATQAPEQPTHGGSFMRNPDGTLTCTERTQDTPAPSPEAPTEDATP